MTKAKFLAGNYAFMSGREPKEPAAGSIEKLVERMSPAGRVTRYNDVFWFKPPPSDREKLALIGERSLPTDATVVERRRLCIAWRSHELGQLVGKEYAEATTISYVPDAVMEVVPRPNC